MPIPALGPRVQNSTASVMGITGTILGNQRHEAFANRIAAGTSASAAYEEVYKCGTSGTARTNGARLLTNADILRRVRELQCSTVEATMLTLAEKRAFLARIVRTTVGEIDEKSPLAQCVEYSEGGKKIKMPDKLRALELDAKLAGELCERIDVTSTIKALTPEERAERLRLIETGGHL